MQLGSGLSIVSLFVTFVLLGNAVGKPVSLIEKKSFIPPIVSGPAPECVPIPWDVVDPCHKHECTKSIHFVVSVCKTLGITCGEGEYLKVSPFAKSESDCCKCAKFSLNGTPCCL